MAKMRKSLLVWTARSLVLPVVASVHVLSPATDSCRSSLEFVITKTEMNYSGFQDKVSTANRAMYDSARSAARGHADTTQDDQRCLAVLNDWLHFFRDGHLIVRLASPAPAGAPSSSSASSTPVAPTMRRLSQHTLLLTLPRFSNEQAPLVTDLLHRHVQDLAQAENLIVDVRTNRGGSDFVWFPVMQLLYTRPIVAINSSILSTPDNIAKFENVVADPTVPESDKPEMRDLIGQLRQHPGEFVHRGDDTLTLPSVSPLPRRVAIVTASGCQSSCEGFVLAARQSGKTCLVGAHTGGVLDYANQWHLAVPGSPFVLWYPTSRSQRLPNDPVDVSGIAPDITVAVDAPSAAAGVRDLIERGTHWPCHA